MVNKIASDSLSNSGYFTSYTISTQGEMKVFKETILYFKLILAVAHILVNYLKIHKVSIVRKNACRERPC